MNEAISIFPFLIFEQSMSLNVICVLLSNRIVLCGRSYDIFNNRYRVVAHFVYLSASSLLPPDLILVEVMQMPYFCL